MSIKDFRPTCFPFAMDLLGEPWGEQIHAYIERLERVIEYIATAESGGELFPVGPSHTRYAEDGNTVIEHVAPWYFLNGKGATFLEAVEDQMRHASEVDE